MSDMTINKTKVAFIGAGMISEEHMRAFKDVPGVELAGICSRTKAKAQGLANEYSIPVVCETISDLYEQTQADLVIVSVTIPSTKQVCLECFEFPWKLLIEKPLGLDLSQANEILAAANTKNRTGYVAFNRRFYSSTRWVKEGLSQEQGRLFIKIQDQEDTDAAALDGHAKETLDNWMFANSIHLVDLIRYFGRAPILKVNCIRPFKGNMDSLEILAEIEFENGDVALYECIWNAQGPWAAVVTSRDLRYELKPLESAVYQTRESRVLNHMAEDPLDTKYKPGFYLQALEAVKAVNGQENSLSNLEDALETTRLTAQIFGKENDRA